MTTMATQSLAPADKAILAMSSSEFLQMTNPNGMDPYSPSECSPVSSVFSATWSRRHSASSTGSQTTDEDDVNECPPNHDEYQPLKQSYNPQNLSLEPPEALTIGACIIHLDQDTLEPAVLMIQQDNQELKLPHERVSQDDLSVSGAVTRLIKDQTSLSIQKIVGVLPETRHHLHDPKDMPSAVSHSSSHQALPLDLTCSAAAASLAAAHAARMARNIAISTTACDICDFMPASKRQDAMLNWRKMARRNRAHSSASRWSRYSDSSSSSASEGAASDSDESTCRLLRDEVSTTNKNSNATTTITTITKAMAALSEDKDQETDGALYMKIPPKSARNSRKTSPSRLRVKYKPLAQDPPTTNIDGDDGDDTTSISTESESDDLLSENDCPALNHSSTTLGNSQQQYLITTTTTYPIPSLARETKHHLEAIQLNYIVLATASPPTHNSSNQTLPQTNDSILSSTNNKLSLITTSNLEQHRMTPQTRTIVQQALAWASGYFYPISPLNPDENEEEETSRHDSVEETNDFADGEESETGSGNDSEDETADEGAPLSLRRPR